MESFRYLFEIFPQAHGVPLILNAVGMCVNYLFEKHPLVKQISLQIFHFLFSSHNPIAS